MDIDRQPVSDERFSEMLEGHWRAHVDQHEDAVYGLHPDLTIGYLNPAWFRFAHENDGEGVAEHWGLGAHVLDAMREPVRGLYEREYRRCLRDSRPWQHDYECSTPTRFREFHMDVFPVRGVHGLLVISTLTAEHPHASERLAVQAVGSRYTDEDGLILQCGYCRRVQRQDGSERWDWIPEWVANQPENVTGGLCMPCFESRFPGASPPEDAA